MQLDEQAAEKCYGLVGIAWRLLRRVVLLPLVGHFEHAVDGQHQQGQLSPARVPGMELLHLLYVIEDEWRARPKFL